MNDSLHAVIRLDSREGRRLPIWLAELRLEGWTYSIVSDGAFALVVATKPVEAAS